MPDPVAEQRLTLAQQAAAARVAYCLERPGTVALLCGPAGVGKTLVLETIVRSRQPSTISPARCGIAAVERMLAADPPAAVPEMLLVDDAHLARENALGQLIDRYFQRQPAGAVALAGEGRLLSLVARDSRLEQAVSLRATLPPFTLAESRMLVAGRLVAAGSIRERDELARTIHEIAGGIPALVTRLAALAGLLAEGSPGRPLVPDDIEAIHRRLCLNAA